MCLDLEGGQEGGRVEKDEKRLWERSRAVRDVEKGAGSGKAERLLCCMRSCLTDGKWERRCVI